MPIKNRRPIREPEPTDENDDNEFSARDFVMARLAAARAAAQAAIEDIDASLNLFIDVEEDKKAKEREELLGSALESIGCATRALESAEEMMGEVDPEECEPWDGDDEEDE